MFGLFGKREGKQLREKLTWAQDASHQLLMTQMELGGALTDPGRNGYSHPPTGTATSSDPRMR